MSFIVPSGQFDCSDSALVTGLSLSSSTVYNTTIEGFSAVAITADVDEKFCSYNIMRIDISKYIYMILDIAFTCSLCCSIGLVRVSFFKYSTFYHFYEYEYEYD